MHTRSVWPHCGNTPKPELGGHGNRRGGDSAHKASAGSGRCDSLPGNLYWHAESQYLSDPAWPAAVAQITAGRTCFPDNRQSLGRPVLTFSAITGTEYALLAEAAVLSFPLAADFVVYLCFSAELLLPFTSPARLPEFSGLPWWLLDFCCLNALTAGGSFTAAWNRLLSRYRQCDPGTDDYSRRAYTDSVLHTRSGVMPRVSGDLLLILVLESVPTVLMRVIARKRITRTALIASAGLASR